jgi:hypothetical protein
MADQKLRDLITELKVLLQSDREISSEDRALLEGTRAEVEAALNARSPKPSHLLRQNLGTTLERLQIEHPRLTGLLSAALDALSDVGV